MKPRDIHPNKRDIHLIKFKYCSCADSSPIQQAEMARERHKLLMLAYLDIAKPFTILGRSNRHHWQQPHKEPTQQPRRYWSTCHSTHSWKIEAYMQSNNQTHNKNQTDETRHWSQPPKISEQYSWWCAGFCLPPPKFPWQALLLISSRWDVVHLL